MISFLLIRLIKLTFILLLTTTLIEATPFDNTIPTLAMRIRGSYVAYDDITIRLLCELSWRWTIGILNSNRSGNFSETAYSSI